MSFFKKLFGVKPPTLADQIIHIIKQSSLVVESRMDLETYKKFTQPIEALWVELLTANQDHTDIRMSAVVCAVAQFTGLHVWSEYGDQLRRKQLISLSQGVVILELANRFSELTPGGRMRKLFGQLIAEQSLALQASMPVVICLMGQHGEGMAREMVGETKRTALLSDDVAILTAMKNAGPPA